jgi:hypothetical protein
MSWHETITQSLSNLRHGLETQKIENFHKYVAHEICCLGALCRFAVLMVVVYQNKKFATGWKRSN